MVSSLITQDEEKTLQMKENSVSCHKCYSVIEGDCKQPITDFCQGFFCISKYKRQFEHTGKKTPVMSSKVQYGHM